MKASMENHHIIPISLYGDNSENNVIRITKKAHKQLHEEQNIPYILLRKYRERTNQILVPNDYTLDLKGELWNEYFSRAKSFKEEQLHSLVLQGRKFGGEEKIESFEQAIEKIIEGQKKKVEKIMEGYELTKRISSYFKNYLVND